MREKLTNLNQQDMGEVAKEDRISSGDRRQYEAHQLNNKRIQENSNINEIIKSLTFHVLILVRGRESYCWLSFIKLLFRSRWWFIMKKM